MQNARVPPEIVTYHARKLADVNKRIRRKREEMLLRRFSVLEQSILFTKIGCILLKTFFGPPGGWEVVVLVIW